VHAYFLSNETGFGPWKEKYLLRKLTLLYCK